MSGLAVDHSVSVAGRVTALHTDRPELHHLVGGAKELAHRTKRLPAKVLIETRANHIFTLVGELHQEVDDGVIKELHLFDEHDLGIRLHHGLELGNGSNGHGFVLGAQVAYDHALVIAVVDGGLKDLHGFLGVERPASQTDEFFALARIHAAAHHGQFSYLLVRTSCHRKTLHRLLRDKDSLKACELWWLDPLVLVRLVFWPSMHCSSGVHAIEERFPCLTEPPESRQPV